MVKVIIQPCYGIFEPTDKFEKLIKSKGYESIWSIEARTDKDLIEYVEKHVNDYGVMEGKEHWMYLSIVEVDTSKPWCINDYDGSEYIQYMQYEILNKDLNYVKITN